MEPGPVGAAGVTAPTAARASDPSRRRPPRYATHALAVATVLLAQGAALAQNASETEAPHRFMTVRLEVAAADEDARGPAEAMATLLGQYLDRVGLADQEEAGWLLAVQAKAVFVGNPAPWDGFVLLSYHLLPAVDKFTVVEAMRLQGAALAVRSQESLDHEAQLIAADVSAHLTVWLATLAQ